jgi:Uncharacterised protein family (UPF0167)
LAGAVPPGGFGSVPSLRALGYKPAFRKLGIEVITGLGKPLFEETIWRSKPSFRYHPDPLATGSVKPEPDIPCLSCNRIRGYIYTGPVFTEKPFILEYSLCPWSLLSGYGSGQPE